MLTLYMTKEHKKGRTSRIPKHRARKNHIKKRGVSKKVSKTARRRVIKKNQVPKKRSIRND